MSREYVFRDDDFGYLAYEINMGVPWIHSEVHYWSHNALKEYRGIWNTCKDILKGKGYVEAFVAIPDDDPKLLKFEKMFGFTEVGREKSAIILKQEL